MSDQPPTAVPTRAPSGGRKLPFLKKRSKNKETGKQANPITSVDGFSDRERLQQQETWPDLTAATVSPTSDSEHRIQPDFDLDADNGGIDPQGLPSAAQEEGSYDLRPPPPTNSPSNLEVLAAKLFSTDHLDAILSDHTTSARFNRFLQTHRPQHVQTLKQYADAKKAVLAVEYANSLASQLHTAAEHRPEVAASLDHGFQTQMHQDTHVLVNDALPAYVTHRLTQLVTDQLVKEITQNSAPAMRQLIPNLAEVYCITDPKIKDNPIVYASQEFYNVSQYGREYVIGRNCRFLQGPKTSTASVKRLIEALEEGQEVCETILNYRRDGSPFMNLLLIAPLYDNRGQLRYFLGCQIDVSPLIDRGRGLESFEKLLAKEQAESRYAGALSKDPAYALARLGSIFSEEETSSFIARPRTTSDVSSRLTEAPKASRAPRRIIGMEDVMPDKQMWPPSKLGPSGRLPGVYQNYLLVRPYPSLRITFTSPALRIPGLLQTKFLDRIGGPSHVRESILNAMAHGTGLTARVTWLTQSLSAGGYSSSQPEGHIRWIHCTPLLGSDERVGVWMVVVVENEEVTGALRRRVPPSDLASSVRSADQASTGASLRDERKDLYAEYLRHDGRSRAGESAELDLNADELFSDF